MTSTRSTTIMPLVTIVIVTMLVATAAALQGERETRYPLKNSAEDTLYVTSGTFARRMALGYRSLAADLYWIRAVQYYGGTKLKLADASSPAGQTPAAPLRQGTAYPLLHPMLELTTDLDPRFNIAYRFGSIFLAEAFPGGAGQPERAIALLEKGLREQPGKWEYMQDIGFVHYWWRHDFKSASEWFTRASAVPGAPWWLRSLAANTLTEGGDRRSSRLMWESIRQSAEIDWLKNDAERRLTQLRALDEIDAIQAAVDAAAARGVAARDWPTLVRAGALRGIPVDPSGQPYELTAAGRVAMSMQSSLYPLPNEPQRLE